MTVQLASQGNLLTSGFLTDTIRSLPDWKAISETDVGSLAITLQEIFAKFRIETTHTEADTETDLIFPVLAALGWTATLTQQNLSVSGRDDVPDGLLFADDAAKAQATAHAEQWKRYALGLAVVESKRWQRPLDRNSGRGGEETAPSTQMLRYLRRIDDLTKGKLRWGILTNGAKWRLYFSGARSVSEEFFELDLAAVLDLAGHNDGLFALTAEDRRHWLRVFALVFRCQAFQPLQAGKTTFHQVALQEGKTYEERVANDLSKKVFEDVFPELVQALVKAAPSATLQEVRQGALILLYRLLFILYAEDRDLLPVRDTRYDDYGLRNKVRFDVQARKDRNDVFSESMPNYWNAMTNLFVAIDEGDASIGLPPYNGGLFDQERNAVLTNIRIPDAVIARVIDALSFEQTVEGRKYINYRNLTVQQLGSIYERLLEYDVTLSEAGVSVTPNIFARKGSGSYYTPDDLVQLILAETLAPLVQARKDAFTAKIADLDATTLAPHSKLGALSVLDPASLLLELKICDPAMGSGHFLVSLVDYLSDQIITSMADAEAEAPETWGDYRSPLGARILAIRNTILANAAQRGWTIDEDQLDDRHIIRRMVLKRCVYGVDKNHMAVELAKVALWLHTFTVGAPLSFLDHHLRCGDSLFGAWVRPAVDKAMKYGSPLLLVEPIRAALRAAAKMQMVEGLTDAEIAEAHRSASLFEEIQEMTAPLDALMSLIHALDWLDLKGKDAKDAVKIFFDGQFGDPLRIAMGKIAPNVSRPEGRRFAEIFTSARELITEERFLNWQVAFPGIWSDWEGEGLSGGFDAIIGNPPWDVYEFEDVAWFAERNPEIALLQTDAERAKAIKQLSKNRDPLWEKYRLATIRLGMGAKLARSESSDYQQLNVGKLNLYKLFVERAMTLVSPIGLTGLVVPSGIASDLTAAKFFKGVATEGRLKALYDFENKKVFFPDVHASFKFCTIITSKSRLSAPAKCAFYVHNVSELQNPDTCFTLTAADFAAVNPNTGTAPIFRSRRDATLTTAIYSRLPILVDRTAEQPTSIWGMQYDQMLNMTNASLLFESRKRLEDEIGAYPTSDNTLTDALGNWVPLYEGKMVQAFDHRAADVVTKDANLFRPGQQTTIPLEEKSAPDRLPIPRYYVRPDSAWWKNSPALWTIGFKDITASTNMRTMIAAIIPFCGAGHTLPVLNFISPSLQNAVAACLFLGNLNCTAFDYVARQKVQSTHFSNYILEQLPVIPPATFETTYFGPKSAAALIRDAVLELTYTAHDMAPFARNLGYVDEAGTVKPPFIWDEDRRLRLRAKLDAVFFLLYGITDRDDVKYIYSTFPIVAQKEQAAHGRYLSQDLCLAYMNALKAGHPDADVAI